MKYLKNNFLKCITAGKHIEAQSITSKMSYKDFCDLIIELGVETQSVALYAFVFRLLFDNESVHLHTLAATLVSQSLSHIEGAYSAALLHLQRAVKLDPAAISYQKDLFDSMEFDRKSTTKDNEKVYDQNSVYDFFMRAILEGKYDDAKETWPNKDSYTHIIALGFDTGSIALYTFICFLLIKNELAYLHDIASAIMSQSLSHLEGAYSAGLSHGRRAIELAPENIDYKSCLLLFFDIPDQLLDACEAESIAREVLEVFPDHVIAFEALKRSEKCVVAEWRYVHNTSHLQENFIRAISEERYVDAQLSYFKSLAFTDFCALVVGAAYKTKSVRIYEFITFLLDESESAQIHMLASSVIFMALPRIEKAYSKVLFHIRCAIELEPNNLSYKTCLLRFYDGVDQSFSDLEAELLARDILSADPNRPTAIDVLHRIDTGLKREA